jgi:hypothetical protein
MSYLKHKPGSIEEMMANQAKKLNDNAYQDMFKKELEKAGRGIGAMSPKEKKDFFNKIDDKYKAKNEAVNEGITSPSGQISQKNKDLLKVNNYITVKGKVYVIDKVSLKNGVYTMKAFDKNGKMHTISSKDVDSVEHWKNSLKVASYDPKNEDVNESASQVQVKRDGKGNFNLMFKGKEIGYYHKSGSKYMVYYDNEDGDYNQSDEVSSEMQAKKLAYDNMNEKVSDKQLDTFHKKLDNLVHKTIGKSSDEKKEAVDNPYAVGMAQAMKSTGDKPPLKKSTITKAHDIAKSIEKDEKNEEKDVPKGYHKMPDGTVMKDSEHKKETHSFMTKDMNKSKKDAKGEKEIVDPTPKMKFKEAYKKVKKEAMNTVGDATADQANQRVGEGPKENDPDIKKPKAKADTGSKATPVDTSPEVEYKN